MMKLVDIVALKVTAGRRTSSSLVSGTKVLASIA